MLGVLGGLVLLRTQVEFPALYWRLVDLEAPVLWLVAVRNVVLLALFAVAVVRLQSALRGSLRA